MSQRTMIAIAASLTAFVLVVAGGVFARVSSADAAAASATPISPAVSDLINQRESAYRSLIDEANQRLQGTDPQGSGPSDSSTTEQGFSVSVSASQAGSIALGAVPGATLKGEPELVRFQGIVAYEVKTTMGSVYVDANTGSILYNSAARPKVMSSTSHEWEDHESEGSDD